VKKTRIIWAITPFKIIQGHRGRYKSKARMRAHCTEVGSGVSPIDTKLAKFKESSFKFREVPRNDQVKKVPKKFEFHSSFRVLIGKINKCYHIR